MLSLFPIVFEGVKLKVLRINTIVNALGLEVLIKNRAI